MEVLLRNGAKVDAAPMVIVGEWRAMIYINAFWHIGKDTQVVGMALETAHSIELIA